MCWPTRLLLVLLAGCGMQGCASRLVSDGQLRADVFADVRARTAEVTGTHPPEALSHAGIPRSRVEAVLRDSLAREWPEEEIARYQDALVALGLWPAGRDLLGWQLATQSEAVVGFYLPERRRFYFVHDDRCGFLGIGCPGDVEIEFVVAHELVHAFQHASHPDLIDFYIRWHDQDDATYAASAAIEGDALRRSFEVVSPVLRLPTPARIALQYAEPEDAGTADVPALIRLTQTFPYTGGYRLAHAEGRGLLARPPASTEQVLHADRRFADFQAIDLSALAHALPAGCRLLYQNTLGELGLSILFRDLAAVPLGGLSGGEAPLPARRACGSRACLREVWEGWDGDRYLAARCDERRAFLWVTAWDDVEDARAFEQAYAQLAPAVAARGELGAAPRTSRREREVVVWSGRLEPLVRKIDALVRRARVSTLEELREHFGVSSAP